MKRLKVLSKSDSFIGLGFTFLAIVDAINGSYILAILESILAITFFSKGLSGNKTK